MEKIKNYFSGEWYKKKSFAIAVAVIVLIVVGVCITLFVGGAEKPTEEITPVVSMSYDEVKDHYGIYNESTSGMYSCKDINGNLLTGYRLVVRAEMKKPMTKEEIYNDAMVIDAQGSAVETEIHFIYKLDNTYNVTVNVCKGEIFTVSIEGRQFITKDEWLTSFENKEA